MANLNPAIVTIPDNDDDDVEFLSQLEAAEAQALSLSSASKRRRVTTLKSSSPSPSPDLHSYGTIKVKLEKDKDDSVVEVEEGAYTAALRGSRSLTWQKQSQMVSKSSATRVAMDACYKCGKEGHWARDCHQSAAAMVGHAPPQMASGAEKACPCGLGNCLVLTANTERNRGRQFYRCPIRQENGGCGFFEWFDQSSGTSTYAGEKVWNNGRQQQFYQRPTGQGTSDFTKSWNDYNKVTISPNSAYGSVQKFETTDNKGYSTKAGSSCFKCGKEGHWARDCPPPSSNDAANASVRGKSSSNTCFKCGQSGHWARDCSQG